MKALASARLRQVSAPPEPASVLGAILCATGFVLSIQVLREGARTAGQFGSHPGDFQPLLQGIAFLVAGAFLGLVSLARIALGGRRWSCTFLAWYAVANGSFWAWALFAWFPASALLPGTWDFFDAGNRVVLLYVLSAGGLLVVFSARHLLPARLGRLRIACAVTGLALLGVLGARMRPNLYPDGLPAREVPLATEGLSLEDWRGHELGPGRLSEKYHLRMIFDERGNVEIRRELYHEASGETRLPEYLQLVTSMFGTSAPVVLVLPPRLRFDALEPVLRHLTVAFGAPKSCWILCRDPRWRPSWYHVALDLYPRQFGASLLELELHVERDGTTEFLDPAAETSVTDLVRMMELVLRTGEKPTLRVGR